jgi:hypothetical protein
MMNQRKIQAGFSFSIILILLIILSIACVTQPVYIAPVTRNVEVEKVKTIKKPIADVWQSAVEWFATHNTPIKNIDQSSGFISTEYNLSMQDVARFVDCGIGASTEMERITTENFIGNFNILVKKIDQKSTKVSVNAFFSGMCYRYRRENIFSQNFILVSSSKINCVSTGVLEKQIFDYLSAK